MYARFKRGLLNPREIGLYLKDSWLKVWLYFFLLTFLLFTPILIMESTYTGFSSHEITQIHNGLVNNLSGQYEIKDGKFINIHLIEGTKEINLGYYNISLTNPSANFENIVVLTFQETGIKFTLFQTEYGFKTYEEIGLANFSFNDYSVQNKFKLSNALNQVIKNFNEINKTSYLAIMFLATALDMLLAVVVASLLGPFNVPFKIKFKVAVYASTVYAVCTLFANLFGFEYLIYLGMVLIFIYIKKAFASIKMR